MKLFSLIFLSLLVTATPAFALTGFFVGNDETPIAVPSTKIIIATHSGHHTLTIMPNVASGARDIALLFPVPPNVTEKNIREVDASLFDAVDTLSAPRLREETDPNPCPSNPAKTGVDVKSYAVTAKHAADDTRYDISVLPAEDGATLPAWLESHGYKLPDKADRVITPYTQRGNAFLLVKARRSSTDAGYLKPLQLSYDAPKLVLPIRLGLINAPAITVQKPQGKAAIVLNAAPDPNYDSKATPVDIFNDGGQSITLYVISQLGRATSPLTRSIPLNNPRMDMDMPSYVTRDFPSIYTRILNTRAKAEGDAMILEYADEANLPEAVLNAVGVNWLKETPAAGNVAPAYDASNNDNLIGGIMLPKAANPARLQRASVASGKPYLTRLYHRYTATTLRQDIAITETAQREVQSIRFFTHLPAQTDGADKTCNLAEYQQSLNTRAAHDEENLARLTGWPAASLRQKFKTE